MKEFKADKSHLMTQIQTLPMPYVVMGVGIPGSGKTTVLKDLAERLEVAYISPDEIREEVTGSQHDQSANVQVWAIVYRRVKAILQKGGSVVVDATHIYRRSSTVRQYRTYGAAAVVAVTFQVSIEVAKHRNAGRGRTVDEAVLNKMYAALERHPVSVQEGFDRVIHYEEDQVSK